MPAAAAIDVAICYVALTCLTLALGLGPGAAAGRAALAVSGVALIGAAIFHLDPSSIGATALHRTASAVAVMGLVAAPFALARSYGRPLLAVGAAVVAMVAIAVALLSTSFTAWGAWERIVLAIPLGWMVLLSARLRASALTTPSEDEINSASSAILSSSGS